MKHAQENMIYQGFAIIGFIATGIISCAWLYQYWTPYIVPIFNQTSTLLPGIAGTILAGFSVFAILKCLLIACLIMTLFPMNITAWTLIKSVDFFNTYKNTESNHCSVTSTNIHSSSYDSVKHKILDTKKSSLTNLFESILDDITQKAVESPTKQFGIFKYSEPLDKSSNDKAADISTEQEFKPYNA